MPDGWELLDPRGWTLRELGTWLDEVGRLGWVQLRTRKGEHRHGIDNTLGALLAGYTHALGVPVAAFVDPQCPRPLDARELERQHAGQPDDLVHAIRAWSKELDQPVQARSLALLDRYRAAVQARHASPLHYVRAFDLHVAELQPVEVEVVVGDEVDGLHCEPERRAHLREERRHGTLDRLLAQDLDREAPVRWLLQAEPGAGKTTLLRRVAHQLALQGRLPVFVPLAAWEAKGGDPVELAVATELGKGHEDEAGRIATATRRAAPERGRAWLLLDGFDEVQDHERMREHIQALAADPAWSDAVLVVTSRAAAVQGGTAWTGFTRASLRLLDPPRQQELVAGLLTGHPGRAEAFWRDVAVRPGVGALLPNPFLLTLTVGLYLQGLVTGQGTPPNRLRLLQRAVEDCLKRGWGEQRETTRPDRWSPRGARRVLRGLSLALHRQGGEAWEPDALSDALFELPGQVPQLRALFGPEGHWKSDRVFLDDIAHYGGLFGPLDGAGGAWRYLHRSFRELLAAECLAEELPADRRAEVVQALLDEQGEDRGAGRSAEVLALLAGMVPEDEAVGHLGRLAAVAPDAGIRALGSVEGLDPVRWLGLLLEMKPQVEGPDQWWPRWNNDDLDAVLDAIRRDGMDRVGRLWEAVGPELPAHRLGVLWYALERLEPAADLEDFLRAAGKADRERPKLPTCKVPAGRFWMGAADRDGQDQERPVHEVLLSQGFRMGSTPLTLAQTRAFDPAHAYGSWSDPQVPAVMLDWFTARLVAAWLGGRLPTEAEWEYACRAGTTAAYWSGDTQEDLARVGWYAGNSGRELRPVGQKPANPWGLHDMHGNTWEWCADRFGPFTAAAAADPASPTKGPYRVRRGGSGRYDSVGCRSATRSRNRPGSSNDDLGFRVVLPARSPAG